MKGQKGRKERSEGRSTCRSFRSRCLLVLVALSVGLPLTATAKYAGGSGTAASPFLLATAEDLKTLGDSPGDWDKQFKMTQNIDLTGYNETNLHMIGTWVEYASPSNQPFRGVFDGDGKTIANFSYRNMKAEYVGLFQLVSGTVKNLKLVHATVYGDQNGAGALVGYLDKGVLLHCTATRVTVQGNLRVGGLAGYFNQANAQNCGSEGVVRGVQYVGGLFGMAGEGMISLSYSKAQVIGTTESVGGLIGATVHVDSLVNSCYARGDVKGKTCVGGLIGQLAPGQVSRCYATGKVTGTQFVGGLVGLQRALVEVYSSFWDTETSTQAQSAGGTGKTTAQMKSMDTYPIDWNFPDIWNICEAMGYPVLTWQIPACDWSCPDGVNFLDFAWFAAQWRQQDCAAFNAHCEGADLDDSGAVDLQDLAIFAENWLAGL